MGPLGTISSNGMAKLFRIARGVFLAAMVASAAKADRPEISAQRLLENWKDNDPGMRMVAEVIASAFASGFPAAETARESAPIAFHRMSKGARS